MLVALVFVEQLVELFELEVFVLVVAEQLVVLEAAELELLVEISAFVVSVS